MAAATLQPGATLAGYRIEDVIGSGGMGVVYRATRHDQVVALKVMAPTVADNPSFRARFVREARHARALVHPNVVPVYEVGEDEGRLFIVMEYIDGPSLDALIAEGVPPPPGRALTIVAQAAFGLQAAHDLGLVHRDVKPGNILVAADDVAYLTDFGLAVAGSDRLTQTGELVGSFDFLAPERINGSAGDARSDIYALGCVLYTALTGRVPFPRDSAAAALFAHINDPPPRPSQANPGCPPAMDAVVATAMAKKPRKRYTTATELGAAALEAATHAGPPPRWPE